MKPATQLLLMLLAAAGTITPAGAQRPTAMTVERLAQATRADITLATLERHTRAIVEHERPSGSPGENAAIDYIVRTLRDGGVPVEVHTFDAFTSDPVRARVEVLGTRLSPEAITVAYSRAVQGLEAPLVDLGPASRLPELEIASGELLDVGQVEGLPDLRGVIVLVDAQPRPDIAWKLEQLGAAGAVFVNPEERLNELIITSVWGTPSLRNTHRVPTLAVAQVRYSAGEAIRREMVAGPIRVRLTTAVRTGWKPLRLAVARVMPGDTSAPFVLLGGHIDGWYHGATDEGASNATMLDLALAFHKRRAALRRGLVVAWWPGHSNGRYAGATWFADHYFATLRDRALAYLNIDGVGQMGAKRFSVTATAGLEDVGQRVVRGRAQETAPVSRPGRNSDMAFNGIGLPVLQFHHTRLSEDGGYWWWHTPDDTFDKVDFDILKLDADLYVDALAELLAAPRFPVNLVTEVEALGVELARAQQLAADRFDLGAARERQEQLLRAVRPLQARADPPTGPEMDRALVGVLRPVHRVLYTLQGAYHPDPAVDPGLLPGLSALEQLVEAPPGSDRHGFAVATLIRERNRLVDALDEAIERAHRLRDRLGRTD